MFDLTYIHSSHSFIAGCDEVGRGPLAGPVVGACALLAWNNPTPLEEIARFLKAMQAKGVTDSKKLTSRKRRSILSSLGIDIANFGNEEIFELSWSNFLKVNLTLVEISPLMIDELNILNASLLAMKKSFELLVGEGEDEGTLLVDGNHRPEISSSKVRTEAVIKGDTKSTLVALASILAKEFRDYLMIQECRKYPEYGFSKHAGYPTKQHKEAIEKYGVTPIHRKTFKGVKEHL